MCSSPLIGLSAMMRGRAVAEIEPGFWQLAEHQRKSVTTIDTGDQSVSESRASWTCMALDLH